GRRPDCFASSWRALASALGSAGLQLADRVVECANRRIERIDVLLRRIGVARAPSAPRSGIELGVSSLALAVHRRQGRVVEGILRLERLALRSFESRLVRGTQQHRSGIVHARGQPGATLRERRARNENQCAHKERRSTGLHRSLLLKSSPRSGLCDAAMPAVNRTKRRSYGSFVPADRPARRLHLAGMRSRPLLCAAAMSLLLAACAAPAPNPPPERPADRPPMEGGGPVGSPASTGASSPTY